MSGAAIPAATIPQAVALIAFDSRTGRQYMEGKRRQSVGGAGNRGARLVPDLFEHHEAL